MQNSAKNRAGLSPPPLDLWSLVRGTPQIDPNDLLAAIESETHQKSRDFRTRILIRDCIQALERRLSNASVWNSFSAAAKLVIERIVVEDLGTTGFPTLDRRIMERTDRETILRYLRELGERIDVPTRLELGGSAVFIVHGLLRRGTEDLDAIDEIPQTLRDNHDLLRILADSHGLRLAHFQSHYLPEGWRQRLESLGLFGKLEVFLLDPTDIVVGKLFSNRQKDRDDLRMLFGTFDKEATLTRLRTAGHRLLAEPKLHANAEMNWRIVFGESLPV